MSKKCELTGKSPLKGHNVSHSNNKTKRKFLPNLKKVTFKSDILKKNVKLNVSNAALRTVDFKGGLDKFLMTAKLKNLSIPPLKSTVLKAAVVTRNLIIFFNVSLLKLIFFRFGKNLLLVLLLE